MVERKGIVTLGGNPLTLIGNEVRVGDNAPDFKVVDNDLKVHNFTSHRGKVCILSCVPSLDTPVCDMETRRFNQEASRLPQDVIILTISMDLPFAQKRWCGAAGVDKVVTLSDHRDADFGLSYGVLIEELRLLARAVFLVDRGGVIRYVQIVPEITHEPDYDQIWSALRDIQD